MQKSISLLFTLFFVVFVAGCGGGGKTPATTISAANFKLVPGDVSGKTFYSTSTSNYTVYQINKEDVGSTAAWDSTPNKSVSPVLDSSGTWSILDGELVLTVNGTATHHFTCIQEKPITSDYFLMYQKETGKITRFYVGATPADAQTAAQTYLNSILISPSPFRAKLGGSIQGTSLTPTFTNVTTAAGKTTSGAVDGTSTAASFNHPTGIATDGQFLYVTDTNNNTIRKIDITSGTAGTVERLTGSPNGTAGNLDGTRDTATFNRPTDLTIVGNDLYVADMGNNRIRKVDAISGAVTPFAGSTTGAADSVDSGNGTDARFNQPTGITTDGTNLYVADFGNHTIRRIVISSQAVATLAGAGKTAGSSDGTGATARFNNPLHITTDGSNLYVTDSNNRTIREIAIGTGIVTTIAGSAGTIGSTDAVGKAARFYQPNGITTDGKNLYVTDSFYNTIRKIVVISEGIVPVGTVTTIAGVAAIGSNTVPAGAGGSANTADTSPGTETFYTPTGITTDGTSLFVSDSFNNLIRRIK